MSGDTRNLLINCHNDSKQKWHEPIIIVPSHGRFRLNAKILPLSDSLAPSVEVKYILMFQKTYTPFWNGLHMSSYSILKNKNDWSNKFMASCCSRRVFGIGCLLESLFPLILGTPTRCPYISHSSMVSTMLTQSLSEYLSDWNWVLISSSGRFSLFHHNT